MHFRWDAFGRLREARYGERHTTFLYDPLGRRIAKRNVAVLVDHGGGGEGWHKTELARMNHELQTLGHGNTVYGWDGDRMAWERSSTDGRTLHHVYEPEGFVPILQASTPLDITEAFSRRPADIVHAYMNRAGNYDMDLDPLFNGMYEPGLDANGDGPPKLERLHFYQCDPLGTPMELTDEAGEIVWEANYKSWGEARVRRSKAGSLAGIGTQIRFQGQYLDDETELHYNRHRYYDPYDGLYVSKDPIGLAGGNNTYAYVEGNPLSFTDPLGLATYMCTKPLHALGDTWGPRLYPERWYNPSPFYHQYVCVPDGKGGMSCGGQDRAEKPFGPGPGKPSTDTYQPESCRRVDEKKCVEQCMLAEIERPNRPAYWLVGGGGRSAGWMNCQQWADLKVQRCQQQCTKEK